MKGHRPLSNTRCYQISRAVFAQFGLHPSLTPIVNDGEELTDGHFYEAVKRQSHGAFRAQVRGWARVVAASIRENQWHEENDGAMMPGDQVESGYTGD